VYFLACITDALCGAAPGVDVSFVGDGAFPSAFAVTDLASASIGAAGAEVAALAGASSVVVDRRLASWSFLASIRPDGWDLPPVWDPIAGDYCSADGWIRLHTNAPHHRAAALRVLGCAGERSAVATSVARWRADELEAAVVDASGCAAAMRDLDAWREHTQGAAVAHEPLIDWSSAPAAGASTRTSFAPTPSRPLAGVRVLDLTRVLAGPVATRFLAGYGADVLRLDPPWWDEPSVVPDVTVGKRCARVDLATAHGRATFERLLVEADVLVHGYRADALERLDLGTERRQQIRPGLIDVSLDAYGFTGPWRHRRGFDSLVQMSSGIAAEGMRRAGRDRPTPLPAQALDHATGYLLAAAAVRGLRTRDHDDRGSIARCSLARTARLLVDGPAGSIDDAIAPIVDADYAGDVEHTPWGPAHRLHAPLTIEGVPWRWDRPATALGSSPARW
jgi:hypothetical protein